MGLCQIMRNILVAHNFTNIKVHVNPCQQQQDYTDCGLFAISNMITIANGQNPGEIYVLGSMRQPYLTMLLAGKLEMFHFIPKNESNSKYFNTKFTAAKVSTFEEPHSHFMNV